MDANLPEQIRIVSLNCWGLKYISKYRTERLAEIGVRLANAAPQPDIVGLQECWTQADYERIRAATRSILPHGKYYHSGTFGAGLVILSRWPIEESSMIRYPLNGRPTAFYRGDWFVGKGVACARIRFGLQPKDVAEVFCTHLHAPYESEPNDSYLCHRTAQAWEIAKLLRGAVERGHLVVGLGDFNMIPGSLAHQVVEAQGKVKDVWQVVHPDSSLGAAFEAVEKARGKTLPTIAYNLEQNGTTCDTAANTWRWGKKKTKQLERGEVVEVDGHQPDRDGRRLDYIFLGNGASPALQGEWHVRDVNVGMTVRHPVLKCSLSDHFSVETTLAFDRNPTSQNGESTSATKAAREAWLPLSTYDEILHMIEIYTARERRQRRLRLWHFEGSIVLSIGCFVAVWWSPGNFVSFILMLISTIGLSAGLLDGLIGGLFVGSELRALKEFEWEIRAVRSLAAGSVT